MTWEKWCQCSGLAGRQASRVERLTKGDDSEGQFFGGESTGNFALRVGRKREILTVQGRGRLWLWLMNRGEWWCGRCGAAGRVLKERGGRLEDEDAQVARRMGNESVTGRSDLGKARWNGRCRRGMRQELARLLTVHPARTCRHKQGRHKGSTSCVLH